MSDPTTALTGVIRAPKTAELISSQLRTRIVRGDLNAGDMLPPEMELMKFFGVSRPTLREAFRLLEAEQLITIRRGARGGATVTVPDASVAARHVGLLLQVQGTTVRDVYEARILIEPWCARLLAGCRSAQDIHDLQECLGALRALPYADLTTEGGARRWSDVTSRFHGLIMARSGNQTLALQGAVLQDIIATHVQLTTSRDRAEPQQARTFSRTVRSYQKLVDLLVAKDADAAEAHWRLHMKNAAKILLSDDLDQTRVVDLFT